MLGGELLFHMKNSCVCENCFHPHKFSIYTDGSRFQMTSQESAKVGCAFIVYSCNQFIEQTFATFKLSPYCSEFQSELIAIREAIKWCKKMIVVLPFLVILSLLYLQLAINII